jgi:SAM-dependent methyltransferase
VSEFTGERVIPGQVEEDLWAEHIARYAFAARLATAKRVLDLGCGTGYGTAELARFATEAVGVDVSAEAIEYAKAHYRSARFIEVSALDLPFADQSVDLVTAFELIEHLSDARALLTEAGPNPFHQHEFEYAEFRALLEEYFPHVEVWLQDRMESFAFYPPGAPGAAEAHILRSAEDPSTANFFVAVCSQEPLPPLEPYVYIPSAANLLREREQHIRKLQANVEALEHALEETLESRNALLSRQKELEADILDKTRWAQNLAGELDGAQRRVVELQEQFARQQAEAAAALENLHADLREKTAWALELQEQLNAKAQELAETVKLLDQAEATVVERTEWAQKLTRDLQSLRVRMERVRQSRWMKLGYALGLGPRLDR